MSSPASWWSPLLRDDDLYFFDYRDRREHRDTVKRRDDRRPRRCWR